MRTLGAATGASGDADRALRFQLCSVRDFRHDGWCRRMTDEVLAAALVAPYDLRVERFPMPSELEPGAVLVKMRASGICGTDKHTYRGETEQYAGTDHASSTPFPIIQGHENVGIVVEVGGARLF